MFSPDNFYYYLHTVIQQKTLATTNCYFPNPGIRTLPGINVFGEQPSVIPKRYASRCLWHDQEPLDPSFYLHWKNHDLSNAFSLEGGIFAQNLKPMEFASYFLSGLHTPILCHSERNSNDVTQFQQHFFSTVHYFYHGLISRDWFRHWKHYNISRPENAKRLGLYARDASGSRRYRLTLLEKLIPIKEEVYYRLQPEIADLMPIDIKNQWVFNNTKKGPESSAIIELSDAERFHIQIVPETLFNTNKTHLTEKVFKPMVMRQPFIIVGPPNSLSYLKSYGFETFNDLWDESYDNEIDPDNRMNKLIKLAKHLALLPASEFNQILEKAATIVDYNHRHFFGQLFEECMLNELHTGLNSAIHETQERFLQMPGGNWFFYQNRLTGTGRILPAPTQRINQELLRYLKSIKKDDIAKQILSKYAHLF